ncbi:hypothetical protein [Nocardia sp. NPDC005978]|uniref:hypothetical protein n=1 Tax=unclassified Nocardia TaxID=2637762 RepID=UPI0033A36DBC
MNDKCHDCWRQENLTFVQRLDPAFARTGLWRLCRKHQALRDELAGRDHGEHDSSTGRAA